MAIGIKTGGRSKGTPNKTTNEIRNVLKNFINKELENVESIIINLEPKERLEIIIKLIPYVLPKVESIKHSSGEPIELDW